MKKTHVKLIGCGLIALALLLGSCEKHAKKVAGTYSGSLEKNDTLVSDNTQIVLEERDTKIVSVSNDAFDTFEAALQSKRYYFKVAYYSSYPSNYLEIQHDGSIVMQHHDAQGDFYHFVGNRD